MQTSNSKNHNGGVPLSRNGLLALSFCLLIFALVVGCASFEHLTTVTNEFPKAKECGKCHVEIYHEWAQSDHAKAYVNPEFRQATDDYAFESCLSCHAPEPAATDKAPRLRATDREEGITCVCCHLEQSRLAGPLEPTGKIQPHPVSIKPAFYRSSNMCGGCHQGTLNEWNSAVGNKETCQQCHMQLVVRKVTQPTEGISHVLVAMEKAAILRRHDFSIVGDYIQGKILTVRANRNDAGWTVQIRNNLPHNLPTGEFGFRVVELAVVAMDAQGGEAMLEQRELAPELSTAIPARGALTLNLKAPPDMTKVSVRLRRCSYEGIDATVLANVELAL